MLQIKIRNIRQDNSKLNLPEKALVIKLKEEMAPIYEIQHKIQSVFRLKHVQNMSVLFYRLYYYVSQITKENVFYNLHY